MARSRSLRTLLLLSFLPVAVLPIVLVGGTMAWRHQNEAMTVETRIEEDLLRSGAQRLKLIEAMLDDSLGTMRMVCSLWPREPEAGRDALLKSAAGGRSPLRTLSVVSSKGRVLASSERALIGADLAGGWSWPQVAKAREPVFSGLVRERGPGPSSERFVLRVGMPLGAGAVLVATYDTAQIQEALQDPIAQRQNRFVYLVGRGGEIVAHTDPAQRGAPGAAWPPVKLGLRGQQGSMVFQETPGGPWRSAGYLPFSRLGGALVASQPSAESMLTAPGTERRDTLLTLLAGLVLMAGATAALSRWIARPIEAFIRHLERMTDGALPHGPSDPMPSAHGLLELDRLLASVRKLFAWQGEAIASLQARTRELSLANEAQSATVEAMHHHDNVRGNFLNALSHDLRIPLTSIMGYAELLQDQDENSPAVTGEYLAQILSASNRMEAMLEELLDYVRVEAGRIQLRVVPIEPGPLVLETVAFFQPLAAQKRQTLEAELAANLPRIAVDPDRLRQVLNNLISNAIKYTPPGGVIGVGVRLVGDQLAFEVSDSGLGMSEEDQTHLFEKFFRSNRAEVRNERGSGLGLFLVKGYLEAQGGAIAVNSVLGRGSTFSALLPVHDETPELKSSGVQVG